MKMAEVLKKTKEILEDYGIDSESTAICIELDLWNQNLPIKIGIYISDYGGHYEGKSFNECLDKIKTYFHKRKFEKENIEEHGDIEKE